MPDDKEPTPTKPIDWARIFGWFTGTLSLTSNIGGFVFAAWLGASLLGFHGCNLPLPLPVPLPPIPAPTSLISLPAALQVPAGHPGKLKATTVGKTVKWHARKGLWVVPDSGDSHVVSVGSDVKGEYWIVAYTVIGCEPTDIARCLVTVGDVPPPGPGPLPPTPPGPGPLPTPTPIPGDGLKVLIVYESADLSKLPSAQAAILTSTEVRAWLNANCVAGPSGVKEWRLWDRNVDASNESQRWQDAMKRERKSLPWILVGGTKEGIEEALPKDIKATLELLEKYKGK